MHKGCTFIRACCPFWPRPSSSSSMRSSSRSTSGLFNAALSACDQHRAISIAQLQARYQVHRATTKGQLRRSSSSSGALRGHVWLSAQAPGIALGHLLQRARTNALQRTDQRPQHDWNCRHHWRTEATGPHAAGTTQLRCGRNAPDVWSGRQASGELLWSVWPAQAACAADAHWCGTAPSLHHPAM